MSEPACKGNIGEPIPLSALQHAVFCLRQAALIHVERMWAENRFTAEGHVLHIAADRPGLRKVRGVKRVAALPLACKRLDLVGTADLVEFHGASQVPFPIEIKRGKPKRHRADEVQLCAQAFCLEEMTGRAVPEGALFYAETRRRVAVPFDDELRHLTEKTAQDLRDVFHTLRTPPAVYRADRCRACSLRELCRPKIGEKAAGRWRDRMVRAALAEEAGGP